MKKAIVAISAALFLISCGGSSEGTSTVDSVAVAVDTNAVTAIDSNVAELKAVEEPAVK